MYGVETATKQAETLLKAASESPVRQLRYDLHRRGIEWKRAAKELEGAEGEAVIELAGSIGPGMMVAAGSGSCSVVRTMSRDGQFSLHIEDIDGRPIYLNYAGPASPVVVQK